MENFNYQIKKIKQAKEGKRFVFVIMDTSFYGGTEYDVKAAFRKEKWGRIKSQMQYGERELLNWEDGEYLENMPVEKWCERYERNLKHVTDKELAEEVNRRAKAGIFQTIIFNVEAKVKENK